MIGILGFGTALTNRGPVSYIEVQLPTGEREKVPADPTFIQAIMDLVTEAQDKYATVASDMPTDNFSMRRPEPEPEPEPYVLEPEEVGFEPPFPSVSQAPRQDRKVPEAMEQFSAKSLLSAIIGKGAKSAQQVGNRARVQKKPQSAPSRVAPTLPQGDFFPIFED
jgi:hypothetical protein